MKTRQCAFVEARNQFELNYLRKLLQITKGNVTHAASGQPAQTVE
ncbi:hypothetical protein ACLBR5_10645 [Escherichia coli]